MSETEATPFASWAILELMGHRLLAGYLTEQEIAGHGFIRLDVPNGREPGALPLYRATQFYAAASVYAITPCSEETARRVAALSDPAPVQPWELPRLESGQEHVPLDTYADHGDVPFGDPGDPDDTGRDELGL